MRRRNTQALAQRFELYQRVVNSVDGVELKGAANPYPSRTGWMTSFLDKDGEVSIRLGEDQLEEFVERYDSTPSYQYGRVMRDFVVMPGSLLEDLESASSWFMRGWEHAGTLKPK